MITRNGYSKDPGLRPEGIAITWGKDLILEKGGLLRFVRFFESVMGREDDVWYQKCHNKPKFDILYVYIIVCNQVRYRLNFVEWSTEPKQAHGDGGQSWATWHMIDWPHLVCSGPFVKAPEKIRRPGFQGFRYTTFLF